MLPHALAWVVAATHLAVIVAFFAGAPVAARHRRLVAPHLTLCAAVIGVFAAGLACPLTVLEKALRRAGGASVYEGGFIDHYLTGPLLGTPVTPMVRVIGLALFAALTLWGYTPTRLRRDASPTRLRRDASPTRLRRDADLEVGDAEQAGQDVLVMVDHHRALPGAAGAGHDEPQ